MISTLQAWLLPLLAVAAVLVSPACAQSKIVNDLAYALPLPIVFIALIIIGIVIFCMMRRARYGYFCCIKPRVIYLPDPPSSENSDGGEGGESGTTNGNNTEETSLQAPGYDTHPNSSIAPPDYQDALQDVLVVRADDPSQPPTYTTSEDNENNNSQGSNGNNAESSEQADDLQGGMVESESQQQQQQELEEVDLDDDSTENCDDTTPLNP